MSKIAIIGAGISGLTVANLLKDKHDVVLFEKEHKPGGLVRCERVNGSLFHICGGHIFNSKRKDVLDWFWSQFDKESEFHLADRYSVIAMDNGQMIPYPIENHVYMMDEQTRTRFEQDLQQMEQETDYTPTNFADFLLHRFGQTLYELYFRPYNEKVWRCALDQVPLTWLEGKLPMPTVAEMRHNNAHHIEEKDFVHARFYYEKEGGSQFIVDRLSRGLDIRTAQDITTLLRDKDGWIVSGEHYDLVIYTGNIKQLPSLLGNTIEAYASEIKALPYHGTTTAFCHIDANPYSWIYQPSNQHQSHRIICTGNFSESNNAAGQMTATVEFTDHMTRSQIEDNLRHMPFHPTYITHHYNEYTYPIQLSDTRDMIARLKQDLASHGFYMTGRFADWEYYNMDVAMGAAMDLVRRL